MKPTKTEQAQHIAAAIDDYSIKTVNTIEAIKDLEKRIYLTSLKVSEAKQTLGDREREILIEYADKPKDLGSNEETRKAKIRDMTCGEREAVQVQEDSLRSLQFDLSQSLRDLEAQKYSTQVFFKLTDLLPHLY